MLKDEKLSWGLVYQMGRSRRLCMPSGGDDPFYLFQTACLLQPLENQRPRTGLVLIRFAHAVSRAGAGAVEQALRAGGDGTYGSGQR